MTYEPMNGSVGRARTLARIKRERKAQAIAEGVDVTDRKALREWNDRRFNAMCDRIIGGHDVR